MTEKFKESIDKGNAFGALLTDLSKAFDCIDHTLLIAKLSAFEVSPWSLKLLYSYLSNRTQRMKINENLSDRTDIEFDVPQGSILGPILLNINLIDLFYECKDSSVASYADETTSYSCTAWKLSKYGVISGPYFTVFGLIISPYPVPIQENTDQK